MLEQRADQALKNHDRMVLLLVLNLLRQSKTLEEAIEKIAGVLDG
jgi:sigma54-dependent transcription regulator